MARITIDGSFAAISLKKNIRPDCWDAENGRATGKTREQLELNRIIAQTETSIREIHDRTVETSGYVTAEQIRNELTGVASKADTLLALFEEHNSEYKNRVGIDRKSGTYRVYANSYNHLSGFIGSKYGLKDYPLRQLDMPFINNFDYYLRVDAKLTSNTIINHIVRLKKMVNRAIRQGTIQSDPFKEYVMDKTEHKYRHLSGDELDRILRTEIKIPKVNFVRDMFLFSCFTGLAYIDICNLSEKQLRKTPDGNFWMDVSRQKTEIESNIKLLDIPARIIEKYRSVRKSDKLFNMPAGCVISYNMRKIEKLCDIRHLHFHMARHTFATEVCLTNGVPMETVSKMMGHSSMRSTQIYAEITSRKVGADMKKLAERTKGKHVIN
jgi:site-specific recombinase XerD